MAQLLGHSLPLMLPTLMWQVLAACALAAAVYGAVKRQALLVAAATAVFALAGGVLIWG